MTSKMLSNINVVEIAEVWAGPFGCSLMGDLGANVIKVESYPRKSETRNAGDPRLDPRVAEGTGPIYERINTHHHGNRNKRNIALDIRTTEGRDVLTRLIKWGDILVESFSAGTIDRLGYGWEVVKKINERITMLSLAGWGQEGPYLGRIMFGVGFDAMAGHALIRGYEDGTPEEMIPILHSDATVPLTWIVAVLGALMQREKTNAGSYIDLAQIEDIAWQFPNIISEWTMNGRIPKPLGNSDPSIVPHNCYQASGEDRWINIAAENDLQWANLTEFMGNKSWSEIGHEWSSIIGRIKGRKEIDLAISDFVRQFDPFDLADQLQALGIIAAPVLAPPDPLMSPQLHDRNWFQIVDHPYIPERLLGGFLWKSEPDQPSWDRRAGLVGEDNNEVLLQLGFSTNDIDSMKKKDIIGETYVEERT
ncbi:MAG: CoA transferase [Dehalococcoidia bacterium]|jgi:crotonobetainyl-CoA:carnitine CoA-transferase CaiB-like acyl-CoA transferase